MDKRKIKTVLLVILTITIFGLSYYVCINRLKNTNLKKDRYQVDNVKEGSKDSLTVHSTLDSTVSKGSKLLFKIKYTKSDEIIVEKEETADELVGKKKSEIEEMYKDEGYKVENITPSEVSLVKELDRYAPNKYVLGIKDEHIAIYKTDKDGNMFIENEKRDITDIKIEKLKKVDIELLTKGDKYFQADTREDIEAHLEDYE